MKPLTIALIAIILIQFVVYFMLTIEQHKENSLQQKEIDGLKKRNREERQQLETTLQLTRDSLSIAFETIRVSQKETAEARERSQKTISDLRKIIFISHSDSSRSAELKSLYKSYTP